MTGSENLPVFLAPKSAAEEFRTGKGTQQSNLKPGDIQLAAELQRDAANKVFSELEGRVDSRKDPLFIYYSDPKYDKSGAKSLKEGYTRILEKKYKSEDFEPGLSVWPLDYRGLLDKNIMM
ncbi:hypothetical protein DPQ22_06130 [Candidatus Tokpelaia sp.]|nr:hypothetical protein DPQ22_06130 [Candidatus Tokpelaia sp.]